MFVCLSLLLLVPSFYLHNYHLIITVMNWHCKAFSSSINVVVLMLLLLCTRTYNNSIMSIQIAVGIATGISNDWDYLLFYIVVVDVAIILLFLVVFRCCVLCCLLFVLKSILLHEHYYYFLFAAIVTAPLLRVLISNSYRVLPHLY